MRAHACILLIGLIISFTPLCKVFCQNNVYHPFPDSNAVWCEYLHLDMAGNPQNWNYSMFIDGDTSIENKIYHNIYRTGGYVTLFPYAFHAFTHVLYGHIRQDSINRQVFTFSFNKDTLLYDYNLKLHDTLNPFMAFNWGINVVTSIDSVLINNSFRKRYWISNEVSSGQWDSAYVALIEGVGSTFGLFAPFEPPSENWSYLLNFGVNIPSYQAPDYCGIYVGIDEINKNKTVSIYPNPVLSQLNIKFNFTPDNLTVAIYNQLGQRVCESLNVNNDLLVIKRDYLPSGIYFYSVTDNKKIYLRGKVILN